MKKLTALLPLSLILIFSCHQNENNTSASKGDIRFQQISEEFIKGSLAFSPAMGVALGWHEYDGKTSNLSKKSIEKEIERLRNFDKILDEFDSSSLSSQTFYDFRILHNYVKDDLFGIVDLDQFGTNPMSYAGALDVSIYINRNFAPLEERLKSVISILKSADTVFAEARAKLADSLARPFVETSIQMAGGYIDFSKTELVSAFKDVKNDTLLREFNKVNENAINELRSFSEYLKNEKLPKANDKFRLGVSNYHKMLLYGEGISMSPDKILEIGLSELKKEKERFDSVAHLISLHKTPAEVFNDMQKDHPSSASLIQDVRKNLEGIRQFIVDRKIVSIPSEVRVKVEETPEYERSTSTASMNTPGPFEKKATEAYYYITPVDESWTIKQKEGWLSNFNYYTTDLTSIHEAYPGHYVQFLHLNASNATKIEKIFGSYAYIEGWAHYAEQMMIDEGFGNTGDKMKAAKYRLAQSNEALLRLCRLCVSIKLHCQGMTVEEAEKFFHEHMNISEKGAEQEASRGTYDPGYLSYTLGKLQILKLRSDYMKQEGSNFSLLKFHDYILDYGMPAIYLLREKMLKDKNSWKEIL